MGPGLWVTVIAVLTTALATGLLVALALSWRTARITRRRLEAELTEVRSRLDALADGLERTEKSAVARRDEAPEVDAPGYVITTLPRGEMVDDPAPGDLVTGREFVSLAAGESLVRLLSLAHGVRRALSPAQRNRIRFEVRREVKRARKQRRRDLKEAKRHLRTDVGEAA